MKLSTLSTLSVFAFFHPPLALAQQTQQPEYYWPGPWHMWGWGFGWMFPMFMLFAIIVCVIMFALGRGWGGGGHHHLSLNDPTTSALQILNERFAKGEIQKQEYEDRKAVILSGRR